MRRGSVRLTALLLATLLLSFSLGCVASAEDSAPVTLTYWCHQNQTFVEALQQAIEAYKAVKPNVTINLEVVADAYIDKMKASYLAGTESDIQEIFGNWVVSMTKSGKFAEVPFLTLDEAHERFYPSACAGFEWDGKLYGIPREYNTETGGMLYAPGQLKALGFDNPPTTFDEMLKMAQAATQTDSNGNITHVGFDFISSDTIPYMFLQLILQGGGQYWADDTYSAVTINTPEGERAMQFMVDLVNKYKVTDLKHISESESDVDYFFQGKSTFCYIGCWTVAYGQSLGATDFDYCKVPTFFTEKPDVGLVSSGWGEVVSANSKNKEAAFEFIQFMTNYENNLKFNQTTGTIPAERAVAESEELLKLMPFAKVVLDSAPAGVPLGKFPNATYAKKLIEDNFRACVVGNIDIPAALKAIEDGINKDIQENA